MVPTDRPALIPVLTTHMLGEVTAIAQALPNDRIALQWDVCQEVIAWEGYYEPGPVDFRKETIAELIAIGDGVPATIELAALLTAQFYSPAEIIIIDPDENRLQVAKRLGATATINAADGRAAEAVMKMTGGRGVDTAIEAVGVPASFITCEDIVAPGGTIANIGVHGVKVDLHLERLWDRNITIRTRLVDTVTTPMLLKTVQSRKIDPKLLITHRFKLDQIQYAYETFGHAASSHALKVIIEPLARPLKYSSLSFGFPVAA